MRDERLLELELLLNTFVELQRISADPGEKSHRLWHSADFIQRQINLILKERRARSDRRKER